MAKGIKKPRQPLSDDERSVFWKAHEVLWLVKDQVRIDGRHIKAPEMAEGLGIPIGKVRRVLWPGKAGATTLRLAECRAVVKYARLKAEAEGADLSRKLLSSANELAGVFRECLGMASPVPLDQAMVAALKLLPDIQREFSDRYAGRQLLLRLDRAQNLILARMNILPIDPDSEVCRFETWRKHDSNAKEKRVITGTVYVSKKWTYSFGWITDSGDFRCAMFRPREGWPRDMVGLRLCISGIDDGVFSHRIYCRNLEVDTQEGFDIDELEPLLEPMKPNKRNLQKLRRYVNDIDDILAYLRVPSEVNFGLTLPGKKYG